MIATTSRRASLLVVAVVGLVATAAPGVAVPAPDSHAALEHAAAMVADSTSYVFYGVAIDWTWSVRADATLEDGDHPDTGELQVVAECFTASKCVGEFTFIGGLGTATCSESGGVMAGHMELYTGPSFDCASMGLSISGLATCQAGVAARGIEMGSHRLAGAGGGVGVCVAQ